MDALSGGDVADVVGAARRGGELEIPRDLAPLAFRADAPVPVRLGVGAVVEIAAAQEAVVLAVGGDELAERLGALHRLAHQPLVLYAVPVVGKGDNERRQSFQIGKLASRLADGDGGVGADRDARVARDDRGLLAQMPDAVRHGVEVRHCAHSGIASARRGAAAARDRLLIRKTRLAKMHMHVAKTG